MHVLAFHDVVAQPMTELDVDPLFLGEFLRTLDDRGMEVVAPSAVRRQGDGVTSHVAMIFDDARAGAFAHALRLMRKHALVFGLAPVTGWLTRRDYGRTSVGLDDLHEWLAAGGELLAHTFSHRRLTELRSGELERELERDIGVYIDTGLPVPTALVYPYGSFSDAVAACSSRYFSEAYATGDGSLDRESRPFSMHRITYRAHKRRQLLAGDLSSFEPAVP